MNSFFSTFQSELQIIWENIQERSPRILIGLLVFILFYFIAVRTKKFLLRVLDTSSDDPILTLFLARIGKLVIELVGLLAMLQIMGLGKVVTSLLATAGISAFIIGFAFKDIGENFLAGMLMAFNRPFKLGDTIKVTGVQGKIVNMTFRATQIKTSDGIDIYIPNSIMLKNPVQNFTIDGFMRYDFTITIEHGQDVEKVISTTLDTLKEIDGILYETKKPSVGIQDAFGSYYTLNIKYWRDTLETKVPSHEARTAVINRVIQNLKDQGVVLL